MTDTAGAMVFHKSFIAYVYTAVGTLLLAGFLGLIDAAVSGGAKSFVTLLVVAVVVRGLYRLAWLRSISWTVMPGGLSIRRGILPWRKLSWFNPWPNLFEGWYRHGFFGFILNYGTCGVTRGEGVTTKMSDTRMHDAKRLCGLVNEGIGTHRQRMMPAAAMPVAAPAPPVAGPTVAAPADPLAGLSEISRLLANGDITREEFDRLKARLIGS